MTICCKCYIYACCCTLWLLRFNDRVMKSLIIDVGFRPINGRFLPMYNCWDVILDYFPIFVPGTVFYVRHHFARFYFRWSPLRISSPGIPCVLVSPALPIACFNRMLRHSLLVFGLAAIPAPAPAPASAPISAPTSAPTSAPISSPRRLQLLLQILLPSPRLRYGAALGWPGAYLLFSEAWCFDHQVSPLFSNGPLKIWLSVTGGRKEAPL